MDKKEGKLENIGHNFNHILDRIHRVAEDSGRDPSRVRLVVVTKTQPVDIIQAVVDAGATDLGENYVEEAIPKIEALSKNQDINWHMIGHVQSRKAQSVVESFHFVHSLDSLKLAERFSRFALDLGKSLPVWMEFNVGGEETKSGWDVASEENWVNLLPDIEKILILPGLNLLGVMTVPPYTIDPEKSRPFYQKLREFHEYLRRELKLQGFDEMSIGMSSDYEVAIQEGSTCVRIGQAILGPRQR